METTGDHCQALETPAVPQALPEHEKSLLEGEGRCGGSWTVPCSSDSGSRTSGKAKGVPHPPPRGLVSVTTSPSS